MTTYSNVKRGGEEGRWYWNISYLAAQSYYSLLTCWHFSFVILEMESTNRRRHFWINLSKLPAGHPPSPFRRDLYIIKTHNGDNSVYNYDKLHVSAGNRFVWNQNNKTNVIENEVDGKGTRYRKRAPLNFNGKRRINLENIYRPCFPYAAQSKFPFEI